jgi:CheY-like chemotaxis protein
MTALPASVAALRLLIVDDDESIQALMIAIFRKLEVTIDSALDGSSALDLIRHHQYDVMILDLMLPGKNGFEVINSMKDGYGELLAHTIILTAASNQTLRALTDAPPVHRVMRKPFDLPEFIDEVFACAHSPRAPRPQRATGSIRFDAAGNPLDRR